MGASGNSATLRKLAYCSFIPVRFFSLWMSIFVGNPICCLGKTYTAFQDLFCFRFFFVSLFFVCLLVVFCFCLLVCFLDYIARQLVDLEVFCSFSSPLNLLRFPLKRLALGTFCLWFHFFHIQCKGKVN